VNCGSILETSLADIWHKSKDLAKMCDSESLEGKRGMCGYRQLCGGCRARVYAATGNYMAEEPFCAYIPPQPVSKS
jgi:radical SAM protein with 4Fe4S-binding SPASM domain